MPSLFSAAEPEPRRRRILPPWRRLAPTGPAHAATAWAAVMLIEVPLVKAGLAAVGLAHGG